MSLHIRCIETSVGETRLFGTLSLEVGPAVKVRVSRIKRGGKEVLVGVGTLTSTGITNIEGVSSSELDAIEKAIKEML